MLNRWVGMGRIVAPLEMKSTPSGTPVLSFTVAVERDFKDSSGQRQTDFIDCVAWRQTAEFINRFFDKGSMICVEGALNKRQYTTQNGEKRWVSEIKVDNAYFTGEAKKDTQGASMGQSVPQFTEIEGDDELPF